MGKTHFPRVAGNQWADSNYRFDWPSGDIRYVHSSGSSTGPGWTPETAYSTIDAAVSACTADNGDVVVVLEDHTETITAAAAIALDVAGVRVIGLGVGRNRPRITMGTNAAASCDVSAARCSLENLVFINAVDSQTAMVNVTAADVTIADCEFQLGDASTQAVLGILTNASASRLKVLRCHMHGTSDAGVTGAIRIVGGDAIEVIGNRIVGAFAVTGAIENVTTATTNVIIDGNFILNQTADGNNKTIVLHASGTGLISNNRGGIIDSTSPAPVTAAAAWVAGNYWSSAVGVTASVLM